MRHYRTDLLNRLTQLFLVCCFVAFGLCGLYLPPAPALAQTNGLTTRSQARRITIRLHKADIHHVLELFAETFQLNLVVSPQVKGRVSIFFRNVPWDIALYWILRSLRLHADVNSSVYHVTTNPPLR